MNISLLKLRRLVCVLVLFCLSSIGFADSVNRTPPPIYDEVLKSELTPLDELLSEVDYFSPDKSDHGSVLQENIIYVKEDGRTYELRQYAYKALSDGNLDDIGSNLYAFRPDTQKIYLIKAETILPDGRRQNVPDEGILIQTPKSDRDSLIYSGRKQMRVIFPQVSKGSVTHCIVLIESDEGRIRGHFTDRYSWERGWKTHLKRVVVNLPATVRDRLNVVTFGSGVPDVMESQLPDNRVKLEWVRNKLPIRYSEKCGGPILQTGPYLCMSTIESWNQFSAWYTEQMLESSEVTGEIQATAKDWAAGASNEDEIIHNLAFRVANDIRYVSLEFRVGGLIPQQGARVLENRFGDCKDKSNLLRMLLKEQGIKSYFVLINTDHAGMVDKRCPHYAYFDHAILMIEKSDGERIFCDPTIKYGSAGLLYPNIANRPALIIDDATSTCSWVEMPDASGGKLNYDWDLVLSESGELSGWFTLEAEGYYAASMSKRFQSTNRETLIDDVERYLGYFYGTSSVMDYEISPATADEQKFLLKAYFVRPVAGQAERSVSWPDVKWLFPRLGEKKDVKREAFTWTKNIALTLNVDIPSSLSVAGLPDDWRVETGGYVSSGNWRRTEEGVQAKLGFEVSDSRYAPPEFAKLYTAVDASSLWSEKFVNLEEAHGAPVAEIADEDTALGPEFVLLSTGGGQLELIDHLYPLNAKPKQRLKALEKTKAWFPKDAETQYGCEVRLAWLAYSEEEYTECIEIVEKSIRDYSHAVDTGLIGWAEYLKAMTLEELGRTEEALTLFLALENDADLNDFRRGYGAYQYARMMREADPKTAVEYYLKSYTYDSGEANWMLGQSLSFLMKHASEKEFVTYLNELKVKKSDKAISMVQWLGNWAKEESRKLNGLQLASWIYSVVTQLDFYETAISRELIAEVETLDLNYKNYRACQTEIKNHLTHATYAIWKGEPEKERSFKAYSDEIKEAIDKNDIEQSCYLALARLTYFSIEVEFPEWIWDTSRMVDYLYRNGMDELRPLRQLILESKRYLPPKSKGAVDLAFIQAEILEREGPRDQALRVYEELDALELDAMWQESLLRRWAVLLLNEGELETAVDVLANVGAMIQDDEDFLPISVLGIYALLELGRTDEAMTWVDGLISECERIKLDNEYVEFLRVWQELDDLEQLHSYWNFNQEWDDAWSRVFETIGLETNDLPVAITFLDTETAGELIGGALVDNDQAAIANMLGQLVMSARWHPYQCMEMQGVLEVLVEHFPDASAELYACVVAMNVDRFLTDEDLQYSTRYDALNALLSMDNYTELQNKSERYYSNTTNKVYQNMYCRFGGLAVANLDMQGTKWLERMEHIYAEPDQKSDPYVVNILTRLCRVEGRAQRELEILNDYLTHNKVDNETMNELLESRLKELQDLMQGNQQLTEAITEWLAEHEQPWLLVFPVPDLDKRSASELSRDVEDLLDAKSRLKLEQKSFLFYAALDERLASSMREDAFYKFLGSATDPGWNIERALPMLEAISEDDRFSQALRWRCANYAVNMAYLYALPGYVDEQFVPLAKKMGMEDALGEGIEVKNDFCNRDPLSPESISSWMDSAEEALSPLTRSSVYLLNIAFSELCRLGAFDQAEQYISKARKYRFTTNSGYSNFSIQLKWRQQVDQARELEALHEVLEMFFLTTIKPNESRPTQVQVRMYRQFDLVAQREIFRGLLQYKLYDRSSPYFWGALYDVEYMTGHHWVDSGNLGPLMDQLLSACEKDSQYEAALGMAMNFFDTDNPDCQEIFLSKTKNLMLQSNLTKTQQSILKFRYAMRIRGGDSKKALADLEKEKNLSEQDRYMKTLKALCMSGDEAAINTYLLSVNTDMLMDDSLIVDTIKGFLMSGNDAACQLVKEKGQEVLLERKARSIQSSDRYSIYVTLMLAELLGDQEVLDTAWVDAVSESGREDIVEVMHMRMNNLHEDWVSLEKSASNLCRLKPYHYDSYYFLGKAQIEQGKYAEGIKSLEPFLRYSLDSWYYEDAEMLKERAEAKVGKQ